MISMNKEYKYRNGEPARVLCVDRMCYKSTHTYSVVSMSRDGSPRQHYNDGRCPGGVNTPWDLIEVTPKIKVDCWMNIYPNCLSCRDTKAEADKYAEVNRIACIHIVREVEEGEGL
jgi:hypothetical protein